MATNPKDEIERLKQQPGALAAGNDIVSTTTKGSPSAAQTPAVTTTPSANNPPRTPGMLTEQDSTAAPRTAPVRPNTAVQPKPIDGPLKGFAQDVVESTSQAVSDNWSAGNYGRAIGSAARMVGVIPAAGAEALAAVGAPAYNGVKNFVGGFFDTDAPAAAPKPPADTKTQTKPVTTPWDQGKLAGALGGLDKEMAAQSRLASVMSPADSGIAAQEVSGQHPMTNFDRTGMTNAQVAQANPAGRVTMQRQPNGTMSFSGGDVSGPVSYANSAGNPLVGSGIRGTGFSRVDSAQAGTAVGMDGAGNYAFTSGNPIAGAAGDSRSPVGMPVEQAQREGLVGQRVGYNPAFDQRLNGAQGQASMSATTSSGVDAALAAAAGRGDFDAVRAHYAGRGQETSAQAIAQQPQAGFTGSIGQPIDNGGAWGRTPEQQRKDAETQASSIHKQTAERGTAALKSLDGREAVNAKAQAEMQQELLRQSGALQREAMRNQSEDFRTASQNRLAAAELSQRYRDSDAQNEIRNLEAASARRAAGIKERFDNATSEAERMSIIRQYPDVFGQKSVQGKDRYITVGGGTSVVDGQTVREPTTVFDTLTQQYVGGGAPGGGQAGQQAKAPEYEKGQVYVDPQSGSQRRWNGTGWERV